MGIHIRRPSQWIEATSPEYVSEGTDDYDEADGSDDDDGNVPVRVENLRAQNPPKMTTSDLGESWAGPT